MSTLAKLKKKAAEFEQKRQFDKALALYVQVLDGEDGEDGEEEVEVALYNRVGDLLLREGKSADALDYYEKAVDLYANGGFFNNAIALCNKILRHAPGRSAIYYKLGKISARKGFNSDAKQNFLEYADRMRKAGELDEAFRALREFADLCPDQEDVRLMLAEQLSRTDRKGEALEQLQLLYDKFDAEGRRAELRATVDRMRAIDPTAGPDPSPTATRPMAPDLVFLDLSWDGSAAGAADVTTAGHEGAATSPGAFPPHEAESGTDGPGVERTVEGEPLAGLQTTTLDAAVEHLEPALFAGPVDDPLALNAPEIAGELPAHDLALAGGLPPLPPLDFAAEPVADTLELILPDDTPPWVEPHHAPLEMIESLDAVRADEADAAGGTEALGFVPGDAPDEGGEVPVPAAVLVDTVVAAAVDPLAGLALLEDAPAIRDPAPSVDELRIDELHIDELRIDELRIDELRARADAEPEQWSVRCQLAAALLARGEREAGVHELELAMGGYERVGDLDAARAAAEAIVGVNPTSVRHHQKLVEYAFRSGDRARLAAAYLQLADALGRTGQAEKARTVYDRVIELAPDDARAQAALAAFPRAAGGEPAPRPLTPTPRRLATITPPSRVEHVTSVVSGDADFVNLGDWLRGDEAPRSTRMVVDEKEPTGDEQADFAEMLRKFKAGVAENVDEDDHESHYDLGIAFKEMGLLDEAIAEFQKALRATGRRVRTYEALGQCFMEKGQRPVARTILARALGEPGVGDEELVGVLYLLGCLAEAQRGWDEAVGYYQRVFAVDIRFRDVAARLATLEQTTR